MRFVGRPGSRPSPSLDPCPPTASCSRTGWSTGPTGLPGEPRTRCSTGTWESSTSLPTTRDGTPWPLRRAQPPASPTPACCTSTTCRTAPTGGLRIVREWTAGATLVERLADGPMDADQACLLGIQVARTLAVAHAGGVTHGALGPGDVLMTDDGRARVAGLATRALLEPAPDAGADVVRPTSADSWAAAAVTYAAVTGRWPDRPRDGLPAAGRTGSVPRPRQVRAGVPKALDQALAAALAEPPDDPGAVARSLEAVLVTVGRRATDSPGPAPSAGEAHGRRRAAAKRAGVLLAVAALAVAAWVGFHLAAGLDRWRGRARTPRRRAHRDRRGPRTRPARPGMPPAGCPSSWARTSTRQETGRRTPTWSRSPSTTTWPPPGGRCPTSRPTWHPSPAWASCSTWGPSRPSAPSG